MEENLTRSEFMDDAKDDFSEWFGRVNDVSVEGYVCLKCPNSNPIFKRKFLKSHLVMVHKDLEFKRISAILRTGNEFLKNLLCVSSSSSA